MTVDDISLLPSGSAFRDVTPLASHTVIWCNNKSEETSKAVAKLHRPKAFSTASP